jgi:hypothetical protein
MHTELFLKTHGMERLPSLSGDEISFLVDLLDTSKGGSLLWEPERIELVLELMKNGHFSIQEIADSMTQQLPDWEPGRLELVLNEVMRGRITLDAVTGLLGKELAPGVINQKAT